MAEIITNLHPDGDENTNLYPNIKKENIPSKSISTDKLDENVLSLIGSLKPSGTDISTNILAYTSNKGIYVATDNGHWYYWNGSAYADGGVYQSSEDIEQIKKDIDELDDINFVEVNPTTTEKAWIRYSNGEKVVSSATTLYFIKGNLPKCIKAFLTSDTNVLAAIAFYSTEDVSTDGYIKESSVDFENGLHNDGLWYEATVPDNCKLICINTKVPSEAIASPIILFSIDSIITKLNNKYDFGSPWENNKCFGHLFTNQVSSAFTSPILIPCQSIFDVQVTSRLGFKYIEANVHKTSDGKYVVTHGLKGKLGNDFEKLDGTQAGDVVIANTTFDVLRTQYRYRSSYDKYKVPVSSLEEFLQECKMHNISAVLQYVDAKELEIAKGYLGDNIILYNGDRNVWEGYIMEYLDYTTKEAIINRCKFIGKPYMYNMANPTSFTDEELKEIIREVHKLGCFIGFTGAYQSKNNIPKFTKMFDFNASGMQINDFEYGNMVNAVCDIDFTDITHNGTVENGVLHLSDGQFFQTTGASKFLIKQVMDITFNGKLYFLGTGSGIYIESNDDNSLKDSRFFLNEEPYTRWVSSGDTYIKNIVVKASKC